MTRISFETTREEDLLINQIIDRLVANIKLAYELKYKEEL